MIHALIIKTERFANITLYIVFYIYCGVQQISIIWVTWRVSYTKQELLTLHEHLVHPYSFGWVSVVHLFSFSVFMFWVPCCDVRYDFRMESMFDLSLHPLVCRRAQILLAYSSVWRVSCCVFILFFFVYVASFSGFSVFDCPFGFL